MDELIVERKEGKGKALKEKLQHQLKTICDRKLPGVNNEPFLEGAFKRLANNGIWDQVLGYLSHPSDVTSAYVACKTFARIFEKKRMLLMLPKVLDVFKAKVDEAFEVECQEIANSSCHNWNGLCLSARGVSKAWKETIDFHINTTRDDWLLTTDDWTDVNDPRLNVPGLYSDANGDGESLDQITSSLISLGLMRSPIRDVHVIFSDRIPVPFYRKLMEYFEAHGSSIRFLYFQYDNPGSIATGVYYKMFCEMLKYMENLKALKILKILAGMNASELFPGINRFHETLQELHIWDIGDVPLKIDTRDVHLELPHLKLFFISTTIDEGILCCNPRDKIIADWTADILSSPILFRK